MQIKVTDKQVSLKKSKTGKTYSELIVFFEKDGEAKSRKMTSYDKVNYPFFKDLPNGTTVNVVSFENADGFWEWKDAEIITNNQGTPATPAAKARGETEDLRQLRIIRQACLKAASEQTKDYASTVNLAEQYVQWVLALPGAPKPVEIEEDEGEEGVE